MPRIYVVEAGRRCEVRRPDLRGIADREGARLAWPVGHGPQRIVRRPRSGRGHRLAAPTDGTPLGRDVRGSPPRPSSGAGTRTPGRSTVRSTLPVVRWSVGSNDRSESISSPKNSIRWAGPSRAGTRRRCHPAARTHRDRRPRSPACSPGGTGHGATRPGGAGRRPAAPRLVGEVVRRDRVLEQGLDARDEDACSAVPPGGEGRDPGGGLVGDEPRCARRPAPSADPAQRPAPDRRAMPAAPRPRGRRSPRLARSRRRAHRWRGRSEVRLGAVWHGHDAGVAADPADIARRAEPLPDGPNDGLRQEWRQYRQVRQSMTACAARHARHRAVERPRGATPPGWRPRPRHRPRRHRNRPSRRRSAGRRAAKSAATRSAMRRSRPRRPRRVGGVESGTVATVAPRQDPPPACVGCGGCPAHPAAVDLARRGKEAHVGLAELER